MKKLISIAFALILVLSFASCSKPEEKKETKVDENSETKVENISNEITVWCWDPAFNIYAIQEAEKAYNAKNKDNPIKVNIVDTPWPDVQSKLTAVGTTGQFDQLPDIMLMQDNAFIKNYKFFPEVFADLTDSGIDFSKFAASKVAYSVVDGKNYGVPFDNGAVVNAVRVDFLEQAGYKPEDLNNITWAEFNEIGKVVKEKTGKPMFSFISKEPDMLMMSMQSAGVSLFNDDGSLNIVDNQELKDAMTICKEMVDNGVIKLANNWDEYVGAFPNGEVVCAINGCWILASVQTTEDQSGKWAVVNMPKLYADKESSTNFSNNGGSSWLVSGKSPNKELAAKFLKETFAEDVDFYNTILPSSGAIATFLPAVGAPAYSKEIEFFGGQKIYEDILSYADGVPSVNNGVYYYEARASIGKALADMLNGEDMEKVLKEANDEVEFKME